MIGSFTNSYLFSRRSIFKSFERIHGKKVLEVGAGTGILSVFACQAGASEVIAVEASKVSKFAELLIKENHMENKIKLMKIPVENENTVKTIPQVCQNLKSSDLVHRHCWTQSRCERMRVWDGGYTSRKLSHMPFMVLPLSNITPARSDYPLNFDEECQSWRKYKVLCTKCRMRSPTCSCQSRRWKSGTA
ncbi:unnamed protein product [Soboliphyme baturini]|uniref:Protein arginine N-methyltransferase 6 n=1 Tax=Soboliphyme baturini TaxID=241478 RepID=A0A183II17_9BILA|nr:unnamed protein product [Soboliphyme baturini]